MFLAFVAIFGFDSNETQALSEDKEIITASIKNSDKEIQISWKFLIDKENIDSVEINVKGNGVNHQKKFSANENKYSFVEGKHGVGYDINITAKKGKEIVGKNETRAVFLDYNKLPDLPVISIDTRNGKSPVYTRILAPKGAGGATITNNEYLECEMKMLSHGVKIADSRAKIRIRGNTSANWVNKPYKLELHSAADLLELGNEYADKEWVLLNQASSMNTFLAAKLANLFGVDWQPRNRFVNLVINGKWSGCCILSESVKRGAKRVNISHSGFIFEYDPYFWKPNTTYFRTVHTGRAYGYTFKFPKKKNLSKEDINHLKQYLEEFEELLYTKNERYTDYIDVDSFATWILIHDLIGTIDGAGSNKYFYKYSFDIDNPLSVKIKRGPLWDFDSAFRVNDKWSRPHYAANYQQQLFQMSSFRKAYRDKFTSFKNEIVPKLTAELSEFQKSQGKALQESWNLHTQLWNIPHRKVNVNTRQKLKFLQNKIKWIDAKLKNDDWN